MQRCLSLRFTQKLAPPRCTPRLCSARHYTRSAKATSNKHDATPTTGTVDRNQPHIHRSNLPKPPISLRSLGMLLNGPTGPESQPSKNHGRWSLRLCVRRICGLVSGLTPENAIAAVTWVVSQPSLPESLRPRVLVKASYVFLRSGNFPGALKMYRTMLVQGFSPPLPLVAALYRAAKSNNARKASRIPATASAMDIPVESICLLDDHHLALLLSTLESSRRPEVMEEIVQKHIDQTSDLCLENPSIVASMIRGYHAAGQLDGCYAWFQRYRQIWATKNEPTPATPYACLMTASRKLMPKNTAALYRIVRTIQEDGIALTTPIYNEILASEIGSRNFSRAFSVFEAFENGSLSFQPDAYTFSLVFDALWKNETGPKHEANINPHYILHQMLDMQNPSVLTVYSSNAALRYFVHIGDFQSAIEIVRAMMARAVSPNALSIRWVLGEILERCQAAFTPAASLQLEHWAKLLLGGLTRDHFAHTSHLVDVIRSTRDDARCHTATRATKDALALIHKTFVSWRSSPEFSTKEQREYFPVLSMIHDILQVCANPTCGVP